ncbi:MAG: hypothetical protein AAGM67_17060 [Bacteroidota bacterium]
MEWSETQCNNVFDNCNACKETSSATIFVAIASFVTSIVQLTTDIQRSTVEGDLNCQRFMGIATGIFGFISTLSALETYAEGCGNNFSETLEIEGVQVEMDYSFGPALICLLVATILKVFDVVCHLAIITPFTQRSSRADEMYELNRDKRRELMSEVESSEGGTTLSTEK